MKKWLITFLTFSILLFAAFYVGIYHIAPYVVVKPYRFEVADHIAHFPLGITPPEWGMRAEKFDISIQDTIPLKGWFIYAEPDSLDAVYGTILLMHGIASCKEHMLGLAENFSQKGFNTIIYDSRVHGESGGQFCTFGFYEKYDVSAYIDAAEKRFGDIHPVGIYGNSFGGAVALQAMAVDSRIRFGIIESAFANLRDVVYEYQKRIMGVGLIPLSNKILEEATAIAEFPADSVRPEIAAREIEQPVLLIHGIEDVHISVAHGERIFKNLASRQKIWYPVEGGNHYNLWQAGGEAYQQKIVDFLEMQKKN